MSPELISVGNAAVSGDAVVVGLPGGTAGPLTAALGVETTVSVGAAEVGGEGTGAWIWLSSLTAFNPGAVVALAVLALAVATAVWFGVRTPQNPSLDDFKARNDIANNPLPDNPQPFKEEAQILGGAPNQPSATGRQGVPQRPGSGARVPSEATLTRSNQDTPPSIGGTSVCPSDAWGNTSGVSRSECLSAMRRKCDADVGACQRSCPKPNPEASMHDMIAQVDAYNRCSAGCIRTWVACRAKVPNS